MALAQVRDRLATMDCRDQGLRWPRQVQNANGFDGNDSKDRYQDLQRLASDNAEPQSVNSQDLCKAGECRLCTQRLQNDFGNDSDPSLHCGVAEGARRVWDKDDEFKSARARRPKGQCRGNAHKMSRITVQTPKQRATIRTRMTLIGALQDKKRCPRRQSEDTGH